MKITEFLNLLAEDRNLEHRFDQAPEIVMLDKGLTNRQAMLIMTGSLNEIRAEIRNEEGQDFAAEVFLIKMR